MGYSHKSLSNVIAMTDLDGAEIFNSAANLPHSQLAYPSFPWANYEPEFTTGERLFALQAAWLRSSGAAF